MTMKSAVAGIAALIGVAAGLPSHGQAALVSCPSSFTSGSTGKVENAAGTATAASACQYLTPPDNNNVASVANINAAGFFGITDWQSNGQTQINTNGSTGTYSIANVNFATYDYAIVFKDGASTNLIAFLFNELYASGSWSTPFTDPPFDLPGNSTSADVSHYSIVRHPGGNVPVPEPATLALLGVGLLGLAATRRSRRQA